MNLSEPFIKRPIATTLVMVAILLFGFLAYRALPVSDLPNIDYPTITVSAAQPGGSPEYMANLVSIPMERNFATIAGLKTMTSNNTVGSTQIVLNFDLGVSLDSVEVEVQRAITQSMPDLPPMPTNPTYQKTNPSDTPILFLSMTSSSANLADLYEYGYTLLSQPISMVEGVSQVAIYGFPFAVRVQADPMKMMAHKVDFNELAETLINSNPNLASGTLQGEYNDLMLETAGQISEGSLYDEVIIKETNGIPLFVGDVANSKNALEQRNPYFRYLTKESESNVVMLAVSRLPGSNTLDISETIFGMLPSLNATLPASVELGIYYDKASSIIASVKDVETTLLVALALVVVVIFIYLGNFLETLIPSAVMPMAIIATFAVMYLVGFSLDNLSLLALTLAIGFIVDDAIVVLENIVRYTEKGVKPFEAAMKGSKEISVTVFTMSIALAAVFIPFIWMPGSLGKIFHEFALTIVIAIFCSGFISLTLNPMLSSKLLKTRPKNKKPSLSDKLNQTLLKWYDFLLVHSIRYKKSMVFIALICVGASYFLLTLLPKDFIPPSNLSILQGLTIADQGSSKVNTIRHQIEVNKLIQKNPYQTAFLSAAGYPTDDEGILYIKLVEPKKRPTASQLARDLMGELSKVVGMNTYLKPFPMINLQVGATSGLGEYQYQLTSTDSQALYRAAQKMTIGMTRIPGVVGVNNDMKNKTPQLNLTIDRDKAGFYGITAEEVESTLSYAYSGGRISTFNRGTMLYDLIVEAAPGFDLVENDLDLLYIKALSTNQLVPLTSVAHWDVQTAPAQVNHINTFPSVTISFGLEKDVSLGKVIDQIDALAKESLTSNVKGTVQGSAEVFLETFKAMKWLFVIAIAVIYLLLGILYESFIHPLTILSALPVAVVGGLLTLFVFNTSLSLFSVVGLIVLIGLVQKNGIMLIDFALEYLKKPGETPEQAILEACHARFRPIIMTTLAAMMGALPIAIGIGDNGATNRPLGLVVVGGLIFSQLLTLFVTPVIFIYMQKVQDALRRKKS